MEAKALLSEMITLEVEELYLGLGRLSTASASAMTSPSRPPVLRSASNWTEVHTLEVWAHAPVASLA